MQTHYPDKPEGKIAHLGAGKGLLHTRKFWILIGVGLALVAVGLLRRSRSHVEKTIELKRGPIIEAVYGLGTVVSTKVFRLKTGVTSEVTRVFVREGEHVAKGASLLSLSEGGTFRAPWAGTVTAIPFREGENIFPQTSLITLMDLKDLYVEVALEQQGALRVRRGQKAVLSFEALRGKKLEGDVRSVFPSNDQFLVHIDVQSFPVGILIPS